MSEYPASSSSPPPPIQSANPTSPPASFSPPATVVGEFRVPIPPSPAFSAQSSEGIGGGVRGEKIPPIVMGDGPSPPLYADFSDVKGKGKWEGGDRPLRIAIVTENIMPKVDGVTRTLARLLEHLRAEGHEALVLGPNNGLTEYAGHKIVGTKGIPLIIYPGLKLNFFRPLFVRQLVAFKPDVVHFVDPIWLGAQTLPAVEHFLPEVAVVSSYHTNLAMYATLFGMPFLTGVMWKLQRYLHGRCALTFCPSLSTCRMLNSKGFGNLRVWSRGVDTGLFNPERRSVCLRRKWGVEVGDEDEGVNASDLIWGARVGGGNGNDGDQVQQRDEGSVASIPPPTETAVPATKKEDEKVVMIYVGRMSWEKNLRLLVEAFRGLEDTTTVSKQACKLVFVGDGPAKRDIEVMCEQFGLDATFMGYRKGEELAGCFASADIFAFPSWTETFGQVVLEAMASGLPVVGLRAEGVSDLVAHGQTGLLLDMNQLIPTTSSETRGAPAPPVNPASDTLPPPDIPANPHELLSHTSPTFTLAASLYRDLLATLIIDTQKRKAMSEAAVREARTHSWRDAMGRIVQGYREVSEAAKLDRDDRIHRALSLSRTVSMDERSDSGSHIEVVPHSMSTDENEKIGHDGEDATVLPTARVSSRVVGRVLKLGAVFRRNGGRTVDGEGSGSGPSAGFWSTGGQETENGEKRLFMGRRRLVAPRRPPGRTMEKKGPDGLVAVEEGQEVLARDLQSLQSRRVLAMTTSLAARTLVMFYVFWTVFNWVLVKAE